ncbi:MAG TPA: hypothetical protein O0X29_02130, partial [Methanocorpusculum sp.]|nr:hypothetical protein [Methanocorpusculum sp.]
QRIIICDRTKPLTGDQQKNQKQKTKTKRQVCPLQPPSKVTNRHYSFGFAKISTLSKTHGTRYHIRFWKKKGMKNTEPYSFKGARLPVMKNSLLFIFVINLY